jgi:hypothetical protein
LTRPVPARPRLIVDARREAEALRSKLVVWAKLFVAAGVFDAEHTLRLRRAWTLLDRAHVQVRRAVARLRFDDGDADELVPWLRHDEGGTRRATRRAKAGGGEGAL